MKTYRQLKAIKEPGMYRVDTTLYLRVTKTGGKAWVQRLMLNGKRTDLGLGSFKFVSSTEARAAAFENLKAARIEGRDPVAEKRRERLPTFEHAARLTWESLKPSWKDSKHTERWIRTLEKHAFPKIGTMRVNTITRGDVLALLMPIWTETPEIARRLRMKLKATFQYCQAHDWIDLNPAGEVIDGALPKLPAVKAHYRALDHREVRAALDTIEQSKAGQSAKLAFEFLVLTAARSGEVRGARWQEIDQETREWRIPAAKMKAKREHRIPLSVAVLEVLDKARILNDGSDLIFPSATRPGKELSDMTLTKILRDNGLAKKTTAHGFRTSFRSWCADTGKDRELAEAALSHVVGGVEGSYQRSDMINRRRALMQSWAGYVTGQSADVVELRA